jgi:hypothetical protein
VWAQEKAALRLLAFVFKVIKSGGFYSMPDFVNNAMFKRKTGFARHGAEYLL